jgi:hypothetical protein
MNTLRWIRNLRGRLNTTAATTNTEGGPVLARSATPGAIAMRVTPSVSEQDRLARIATLLTADTDARLHRIAVLLTTDMDARPTVKMDA